MDAGQRERAVVDDVPRRAALLLRRLLAEDAQLGGLIGFEHRRVRRGHGEVDLARIAAAQGILRPDVQAKRGGHHDEHHRAQDADGRQARAVPLHAVGHGGDGHEMLRRVVKPLVLLQQAAQRHGAGDQQQIGAYDHHHDGHEEPDQRGNRVRDGHGKVIGAAQEQKPEHRAQPVGLRRLFACVLAAQQVDRVGELNLPQGVEVEQREDRREERERAQDGTGVHAQRQHGGAFEHFQDDELRQLGEKDAARHAARKGDEHREQRFPQQHHGQVALAQAEDVVKPEFALAPPDEEGVRVEEEDDGKHAQHAEAEAQDALHVPPAAQQREGGAGAEERHDVAHHHHAGAGEQIGHI